MGLIWDVPSGQLTVVAIVIHQLIGRTSHSGLKDIQAVTRWVSWRVRSNKAYPMNMYNIIPPKWAMKLQSNIWLCWNMLNIVEPTIRLNYNNLQTWITNGDDSPQSFLHHSSDIVRSLWFIQTNVWGLKVPMGDWPQKWHVDLGKMNFFFSGWNGVAYIQTKETMELSEQVGKQQKPRFIRILYDGKIM